MIDREKLMAYVDGELPAEERAAIDAELADNEPLRRAVAEERLLRRAFAQTYDPALEEPIPEPVARLLAGTDSRVVPFKRPPPAPPRWHWQSFTAIAASLVLGVVLGSSLGLTGGGSQDQAGLGVDGELAAALETQLASTQTPASPIQVGISFVGADGRPCRTFETSQAAGLACRAGPEWDLRLLAPRGAGAGPTISGRAALPRW
jgi:anti-sigma factor RsiW